MDKERGLIEKHSAPRLSMKRHYYPPPKNEKLLWEEPNAQCYGTILLVHPT